MVNKLTVLSFFFPHALETIGRQLIHIKFNPPLRFVEHDFDDFEQTFLLRWVFLTRHNKDNTAENEIHSQLLLIHIPPFYLLGCFFKICM